MRRPVTNHYLLLTTCIKKGKKGNDTTTQYRSAFTKWFVAFCVYAKWDLTQSMVWVDEAGEVPCPALPCPVLAYLTLHPALPVCPTHLPIYGLLYRVWLR